MTQDPSGPQPGPPDPTRGTPTWIMALLGGCVLVFCAWGAGAWMLIPLDIDARVDRVSFAEEGAHFRVVHLSDGRELTIDSSLFVQMGRRAGLEGQRIRKEAWALEVEEGDRIVSLRPSSHAWRAVAAMAGLVALALWRHVRRLRRAMTSSGEAAARWPSVRASWVRDFLVLVGAAAAIQLLFAYRHDWPAHLVAGGAGVVVVAACTPRRAGRWAGLLAFVAMAILGGASERTLVGPPDMVDVSFTLAGALLCIDAASDVSSGGRATRGAAAALGVSLVVLSLAYRYGIG